MTEAESASVVHNDRVHITLIVNPFASSVSRRARVMIQRRIAAEHELEIVETTKRGHAIRLAYGAARVGTDLVVALGGDGTINEVANGVLGLPTTVAPLPGGSTNVLARILGFPNDPVGATSVLLDALARDRVLDAGVGLANGRVFLFHCGAGFDAAVVEQVEHRGPLKRYAGHALFVATTIDTWRRRVDRRHPWFRITSPDTEMPGGAHLVVALNCNPYTFLGDRPLDLAPEADLHTPLSLVALHSLELSAIVRVTTTALAGGNGIADEGATSHRSDIHKAEIVGYRPFPYQLDGESFGPVDRLSLEYRPSAIRLVVPGQGARA